MNVYDFDKTIYDGDSTVDFYFFCLRHYPGVYRYLPTLLWYGAGYVLGLVRKTNFKEHFYRFLRGIPDIDVALEQFWDVHMKKIIPYYLTVQKADDLVISASPEFLVIPGCRRLGISDVMASRVNQKTGLYTGENCHGTEKVRRYREKYGEEPIQKFYSDSLSDTPLAELAEESYLVSGHELILWQEYKPSFLIRLKSKFAKS